MAITLQLPSMLDVTGSTLKIVHPDISSYTRTYLASTIAASGTTMTVADNENFEDDDWFIIGEVGDEKTEPNDVNGAVTRGTSLTVTNTLKFGHEIDSPVTRIFERQIRVYGVDTDTNVVGSATLIATIDITWSKPWTEYTNTGTQYSYYFAVYFDGTTPGGSSDTIPAAGANQKSAWKLIERALEMSGAKLGPKDQLGMKYLVDSANECQTEITQYVDPQTNVKKDWAFEIVLDEGIEVTQGENRYSISGLTNTPKYSDTAQAILNVYIGSKGPLLYTPVDEFDRIMEGKKRTQLSAASSVGGTSISVDDTSEFSDTGSLTHGADTITYTGKTDTTFTGIPASGDGSITAIGPDNLAIWQGVGNGLPDFYSVFDGNIFFTRPIDSQRTDYRLRIRMLKQLVALSQASDITEVTFHNVFPFYIAYKIELRRKNFESANNFKNEFELRMLRNAKSEKSQTLDQYEYYNFDDGDLSRDRKWPDYPNSAAGLSPSI